MTNPSLVLGFYEKDTLLSPIKTVTVNLESINLYSTTFSFPDDEIDDGNIFYLPILPDSNILKLTLNYDYIWRMRYKDTLILDTTITKYDTLYANTDSMFLDPVYKIDSITTYNDTVYNRNFTSFLNLYYTSKLVAVSEECGFSYEYYIDSVKIYGPYFDTSECEIVNDKIYTPESLYENEPENIHIYF